MSMQQVLDHSFGNLVAPHLHTDTPSLGCYLFWILHFATRLAALPQSKTNECKKTIAATVLCASVFSYTKERPRFPGPLGVRCRVAGSSGWGKKEGVRCPERLMASFPMARSELGVSFPRPTSSSCRMAPLSCDSERELVSHNETIHNCMQVLEMQSRGKCQLGCLASLSRTSLLTAQPRSRRGAGPRP